MTGVNFALLNTGSSTQLSKSLLLTSSSSQYISKTSLSVDQRQATWAFWAKPVSLGVRSMLFASGTTGAQPGGQHELESSNDLASFGFASRWSVFSTASAVVDTNWHHYTYAYDLDSAAQAQRVRIYLDGVEVTYSGSVANPNINENFMNATEVHNWGFKPNGPGLYFNGKLADLYYINNTQLTPSSFITGTGSGTCHPTTYMGSFGGSSGYHLSFSNSDLTDTSGNGNTFTNNGGATFSSDVPT